MLNVAGDLIGQMAGVLIVIIFVVFLGSKIFKRKA